MIRAIKQISFICCGVLIYSFIGGFVYSAHEHFYPGSDYKWYEDQYEPPYNGSFYVGVGWPIMAPAWGVHKLVRMAISEVFIPIIDAGGSAAEDMIDE